MPDSNDSIKYPPRDKNPGSFSWDIRFPAGKVQAAKSFIEISSDAGGADILEVARLSLETSPISGSKELPAGTYFFRLRLANDLSTVVFGGVINVQVGEVTSFIRNYSDADFKPFVNLLVNLQADSFIPVTPVEATVEFYDNSSAAGAAMANVNGTSDTRHIPAAALGQVFRSEGWTALPNDQFDPQYPAQFWAKLILTDNAGRQFIKIRGPYTTTGQELEIGIGAAAASFTDPAGQLNLLYPVVADTSLPQGSFSFLSIGSDGVEYPDTQYAGAEAGCEVHVFAAAAPGYGINEVEIQSTPVLDQNTKVSYIPGTAATSEYFLWTMPELHSTNAKITGQFLAIPFLVRLENAQNPNDYYKVSFGYYQSLEEAVSMAAANGGAQTISLLGNIDAKVDAAGNFIVTQHGVTSIEIPSGSNITLTTADAINAGIKRTAGFLSAFFTVNGRLALSAGLNAALTLDGNDIGSVNTALVTVESGAILVQNNGVVLQKNKNITAVGGAVDVKGSFTMAGGSIRENTAPQGAAVFVQPGANFTMAGSAYISSDNIVELSNTAVIIYTSGTLTPPQGLSSATIKPAAHTEGLAVLDNAGAAANYMAFAVTSTTDTSVTPNVGIPWRLSNTGKLYGPEARLDSYSGVRSFHLSLAGAFNAASGTAASLDTITVLKDFTLNNNISTAKYIKLTAPPNQTVTIKRSPAHSAAFFDITAGEFIFETSITRQLVLDGDFVQTYGPLVAVRGGRVVMNEGASFIRNTNMSPNTRSAGALYITGSSTQFVMSGGNILDNSTMLTGGGIYMTGGTFTMTGGSIRGNYAGALVGATVSIGQGGGVFMTAGSFMLSGGVIGGATGNYARDGAGVYVSGGLFEISGTGAITNNMVLGTGDGGGVNTGSAARFKMTGGSISGNLATRGGDDVHFYGGDFEMEGTASAGRVYLDHATSIKITGALAGSIVTTLSVPVGRYTYNQQVLSDGSGYTFTRQDTERFMVTPQYPAETWLIDIKQGNRGKIKAAVAQLANKDYLYLDDAINDASGSISSPSVITIIRVITLSSSITIPASKHIEITTPIGSWFLIKRFAGSNISLFVLNNQLSSLTLSGNIVIDGDATGTAALVSLSNGTFTMKDQSFIKGTAGPGVYVTGGTFTLLDSAVISQSTPVRLLPGKTIQIGGYLSPGSNIAAASSYAAFIEVLPPSQGLQVLDSPYNYVPANYMFFAAFNPGWQINSLGQMVP